MADLDEGVPGARASTDSNISSSYMRLINSLATDLDSILTDLDLEVGPADVDDEDDDTVPLLRGDGFLEPYMAGLGPDAAADAEPSVLRSKRPMPRPRARPRPRTILTSDTDDDNDIDDDLVDDEEDDDSPDPGTAGRRRGAAAAHAA